MFARKRALVGGGGYEGDGWDAVGEVRRTARGCSGSDVHPALVLGPLTEVNEEKGMVDGTAELSAGMRISVSRDKGKRSEGAQ